MSIDNQPAGLSATATQKRPTAKSARTKRFIARILTFFICFATWIVLSGRFDIFHISLGVIACTIVASLSSTLLISRRSLRQLPRQWLGFVLYVPWLLYQVFLANLHVMYLAFHPRMLDLIDPKIVVFKSRLKKPMSLFIFANSITLTPGTITVYVSITGEYTIHVIDTRSATSLPGDMENRVARVMGE